MIAFGIELLKRYLPQIIGAILIIALYFWWRHEIIAEAEGRVNAEWIKRDAETQKQSDKLMQQKTIEHDQALKHQQETYIGAIESYAEHIENLNRDIASNRDKRLYVSTKTASCSGGSMPTKTGSAEANNRGREAIHWAELESEIAETIRANAAEVERGRLACAELLKIVESEMVIK